MSDHKHVRIHLKQVIMIGHGKEARYAKVVTGIRRHGLDEQLSNGEALVAIDVYGYVTGIQNSFRVTPVDSHTYLLAGNNILSIEDMALAPEEMHLEYCPPSGRKLHRPAQTQACARSASHDAHSYHNPRAMLECPGITTKMCEHPEPHTAHQYNQFRRIGLLYPLSGPISNCPGFPGN